jgi:hypothetical protein
VEAVASDDSNASPTALPPILKRASNGAQVQGQGVAVQDPADANLSHDEYVTKRKADLYDMGMSENPASLKIILSEIHNPDPEIRQAALTATMDLGSPEAIPALQNEMAWAEDLQEKMDLKNAIDFLQLPKFGASDETATTRR